MNFDQLCEYALEQGAKDVSFDYQDFSRRIRQIEYARQHTNSVEAVAVRAGVHVFGKSVHEAGMSTRKAAGICRSEVRTTPYSREQAMLWFLGSALVNEAYYWLPTLVRAIASGWGSLSGDEQLKMVKTVSGELRKSLDIANYLEYRDGLEKYSPLRQMFIKRSTKQFLPAKFGELGIDEHQSCLGMSILLSAFAARTGARFFWVTPTSTKSILESDVKRDNLQKILEQYRGCRYRDRGVFSRIKQAVDQLKVGSLYIEDWHHAVVIQLNDGRWVLLDPYADATCVIEDTEKLNHAYRLLMRYRYLLPGLALQIPEIGSGRRFARDIGLNTDNILSAAMAFREDAEADWYKTVDSLVHSTPVRVLAWATYFEHHNMELDKAKPLRPETLAEWWTQRGSSLKSIDPEEDARQFGRSKSFRSERLPRIEAKFYEYAVADLDTLANQWRIAHPAMEFQLPGTGIALAVLSNLLSLDDGLTPSADLVTLLLSHTNAQMLWHEAVVNLVDAELTDAQKQIMEDARCSVEASQSHHQLCDVQLRN